LKVDSAIWFLAIGFILFFTFPLGVIISDEYSYLTLGLKLGQHLGFIQDYNFKGLDIYYQKYSVGYPLVISMFSLLGAKASYLGNMIMLLFSVVLLRKICIKLEVEPSWAFVLAIFMPVVFSTRTLLSEMSALLLVIIFLYVYYSHKRIWSYFLMGFICVLSFWFREGTIVLLFPLLLYRFSEQVRLGFPIVLGMFLGLSPAILQYSFYEVLELRNTGVSFGFSELISNVSLALYTGLFVFPLGLICMYRSKVREKNILVASMAAYTMMQVLYQYNGLELTGLKALITYPRFYIVLAPFFIIFYASSALLISNRILYLGSIVVFFIFSSGFYFIDLQYEKVRRMVYQNVTEGTLHTNGTVNEISKIIFPERGSLSLGMINTVNGKSLDSNDYILNVKRSDSALWKNNLSPIHNGVLIDSISIMGFLEYRLLKVQ